MNTILIVLTLVEVLLLVLVLAGYLLAITGTLQKIASTVGLIRIGVHAIDEQLRPIEPELCRYRRQRAPHGRRAWRPLG